MARTITHTTQAWLQQDASTNDLQTPAALERVVTYYTPPGSSLKYWESNGYTLIGTATITVEIPDESAIYAAKVESLKAAKTQVLAEAQAKATDIESEIQKLLAISFDGVTA